MDIGYQHLSSCWLIMFTALFYSWTVMQCSQEKRRPSDSELRRLSEEMSCFAICERQSSVQPRQH